MKRIEKNRIEWIDALKGFGIFCVTLGHLKCQLPLETYIYSFHMFLFFFLSGFLHSSKNISFKEFLIKKTKTLFIPFLLWNLLSSLIGLTMNIKFKSAVKMFFLIKGTICWNAPIWFLLLLYMCTLIYFFIDKYIPFIKFINIPILFLLWKNIPFENIFLKLNILPVCLLFYTLGNIYKPLYNIMREKFEKLRLIFIPLCGLLLYLSILFGRDLNKRISFTKPFFGNVTYCGLGALFGVLFFVQLFQCIPILRKSKLLTYLGKNSLMIMVLQYYVFLMYDYDKRLIKIAGGKIRSFKSNPKAFLMTVVTILIICLFVEIWKFLSRKNNVVKKICVCFGINV